MVRAHGLIREVRVYIKLEPFYTSFSSTSTYMSTTAAVLEDTSTTGSFMLPGMGSPEEISCSRVVRFHNECVLIPKATVRPKLPVVLTKSYSLPLWKRKTPQFSDSDVEDAAGSLTPLQSSEDKRVTIKVPIPTLVSSSIFHFVFKLPFFFQVWKKVAIPNSKV